MSERQPVQLADTRPGRTAKFAMAFTFIALSLWIVLDRADVVVNGFNSFFTLSVTLGGLLGTLHLELREQMMLGDTGSNAVGGRHWIQHMPDSQHGGGSVDVGDTGGFKRVV